MRGRLGMWATIILNIPGKGIPKPLIKKIYAKYYLDFVLYGFSSDSVQAIVDVGIEEKSDYSFKNSDYSFICNDPDKLKENWLKQCPTDFRKPTIFYKNIGCTNWEKVETCDIEVSESDTRIERICNFTRIRPPTSDYLRQAMMQMGGK